MNTTIKDYLGNLQISSKQSFKNLAMYPLICPDSIQLDYLLLDDALAGSVIDIVEVDKGGSVPDLKVVNKSAKMVLLLDGEELVGAKQNRVINTTILIAANSTTTIPVSCVESGRWTYRSEKFYSENRVMSPTMRSRKTEQVNASKKINNTYRSDQGAIWDEINWKAQRMNAMSDTMCMSAIYKKEMPNIQEYVKHFSLSDNQAGAVFLINGKVVGLDSFGKNHTFSKVFNKLIESYALDAIDWLKEDKNTEKKEDSADAFLATVGSAQTESTSSVALGSDVRLESEKIAGFALMLDDTLLHLSAFARSNGNKETSRGSKMERFSQRRRNRE